MLLLIFGLNLKGQELIKYGDKVDENEGKDTIVMPEYPGGEDEFFQFLEYRLSQGNTRNILHGVGDIVSFSFVVSKSGKIEDFKMISTTNPGLIFPLQEAMGLMKDWNPGTKNGKAKKFTMEYTLRIRSIPQIPYVEVTKEQHVQHKTTETNNVKWFLGVGAVLVLIVLLLT